MPSTGLTSQGPLGCGEYNVQLVNDGKPIISTKRLTSVLWSRRRGEASTATITIPVQGNDLTPCCVGADRIETLRTEILIARSGMPVWQGWLLRDAVFSRDNIVINAHDILGWTQRRTIKTNFNHVNTDLTDIAIDYLEDINQDGDLPLVISSSPTGILATRTVLANEDRFASDVLSELYNSGLDITVLNGVIILGPQLETCGAINLRDTDIDGFPEIHTDGEQRATRVVVKGANGIRSVFPPESPDVCYHAADIVVTDENILDQNSADIRAEDEYEAASASYPYFLVIPQGSGLGAKAPVSINALIPGVDVNVSSDSLCLPIFMTQQLTALDVDVADKTESVRVTVEPFGDNEVSDG